MVGRGGLKLLLFRMIGRFRSLDGADEIGAAGLKPAPPSAVWKDGGSHAWLTS